HRVRTDHRRRHPDLPRPGSPRRLTTTAGSNRLAADRGPPAALDAGTCKHLRSLAFDDVLPCAMVAVPPLGPSKHAVALATWDHLPLRVRVAVPLSDDELFELCQVNRDLRIERTADGEIWVMPPTGGETGRQNSSLTAQLGRWSELDGSGVSFDSSTGFLLPNGAERSPDAAWVALARWQALSAEDRARFPPLCPDFVVELRSRSDEFGNLRAKM